MRLEQPDLFALRPLQPLQRSYGSVRPRRVHRYSVPRFSSLGRLPWHHAPSSRSSTEAPESSSRPLYAGHRPPSTQAPDGLVPEIVVASGFDVCYSVSTPQRGFVVTRLLDSHLTHHVDAPSPPTLTTTVFSQGRSGVVWSRPLQADSGGSVPPSLRQLLMPPGQLRANRSRIAAAHTTLLKHRRCLAICTESAICTER
jgi:hypothetical protein